VPNARWVSGRHLPSSCLTLQSPPLHCAAQSTVGDLVLPLERSGDTGDVEGSQVLVMLHKGHLHLYHSVSGIKVRVDGCDAGLRLQVTNDQPPLCQVEIWRSSCMILP
jgi:hypothetical protein